MRHRHATLRNILYHLLSVGRFKIMRAIVQTDMISIALALLPLLLAMGCAGTPDAGLEGSAGSAVTSATTPPAPAPVLDTPSNVPE